eukprot:5209173-Amphidinium_carterae.2
MWEEQNERLRLRPLPPYPGTQVAASGVKHADVANTGKVVYDPAPSMSSPHCFYDALHSVIAGRGATDSMRRRVQNAMRRAVRRNATIGGRTMMDSPARML